MIHISAICDTRAKLIWRGKATNKKTHIAAPQIQSPCDAMYDNPFIVHEFFCAQKRGTRRSAKREQTRIISRRGAQVASRSRYRIFRGCVTIMQQIDCNPQFRSRELSAPARKKFISFAVSQSGARAETLFGARNCDARSLFAPRESKPARLLPWLRSLGCDRQRQSPPRPYGSRSACANAAIY